MNKSILKNFSGYKRLLSHDFSLSLRKQSRTAIGASCLVRRESYTLLHKALLSQILLIRVNKSYCK